MGGNRKKQRLKGFNYGSIGAYFITVCAKGRQSLFGKVEWRTEDGAPYNAGLNVGRTVPGEDSRYRSIIHSISPKNPAGYLTI